MNRNNAKKILPKQGQVACFAHLHLQTLDKLEVPINAKGEFTYQINGKPRPMYVLSESEKRGERWFSVAPITHRKREDLKQYPVGNSLEPDSDKPSYINVEVVEYPESMLHECKKLLHISEPFDRIGQAAILKAFNHMTRH